MKSKIKFSRTDPYLKKIKLKQLIISLSLILLSLTLIFVGFFVITNTIKNNSKDIPTQEEILNLWNLKDYSETYALCNVGLSYKPTDSFFILMKGFSAFYMGIAENDGNLRLERIDESILLIRKALVENDLPLTSEALYVLGKAYYYKGLDYYDLALTTLQNAIDNGCNKDDVWEFLALSAWKTGDIALAINYFEKAIVIFPDSLELAITSAQVYFEAGMIETTKKICNSVIEKSNDEYLVEKSYFLLADVFRKKAEYENALECYNVILEKNPKSADACYYQGLVFIDIGDSIKARAAWRKAITIDPMHTLARQKLSERL